MSAAADQPYTGMWCEKHYKLNPCSACAPNTPAACEACGNQYAGLTILYENGLRVCGSSACIGEARREYLSRTEPHDKRGLLDTVPVTQNAEKATTDAEVVAAVEAHTRPVGQEPLSGPVVEAARRIEKHLADSVGKYDLAWYSYINQDDVRTVLAHVLRDSAA